VLTRILLSFLVLTLFFSTSNAFRIITMGRNSCAEAGTCCYLVHNGRLHEDDYCPSCRKTLQFSVSYLSHNSELWKGVCFRKYPPAMVDPTYPGTGSWRKKVHVQHALARRRIILLRIHQEEKWVTSVLESHPTVRCFRRFGMISRILKLTEPSLSGLSVLTTKTKRTQTRLKRSGSPSLSQFRMAEDPRPPDPSRDKRLEPSSMERQRHWPTTRPPQPDIEQRE
jgi:hypothetical protein